ncbi:hypothetical protein GCM10010267_67550 [Streptomyces griseorubens]|nr:hypothetical protein GCM10010267_67550 [Streptomyces griseorubens]
MSDGIRVRLSAAVLWGPRPGVLRAVSAGAPPWRAGAVPAGTGARRPGAVPGAPPPRCSGAALDGVVVPEPLRRLPGAGGRARGPDARPAGRLSAGRVRRGVAVLGRPGPGEGDTEAPAVGTRGGIAAGERRGVLLMTLCTRAPF